MARGGVLRGGVRGAGGANRGAAARPLLALPLPSRAGGALRHTQPARLGLVLLVPGGRAVA